MDHWKSIIDQLTALIRNDTMAGSVVMAALIVIASFAVWLIIKLLLTSARKRLSSVELVRNNPSLFKMIGRAAGLGLLLVSGILLIGLFELQFLEKLFPALLVVLFAGPINGFLLIVLRYFEQKWAAKTETKIDNIIFDLLNKFSGTIIYAAAVVIALDLLGINVMPFVAGAGIMGVAIGFASKDTLSNLIAGILLIIDRPFEMGDRIEVWSAPTNSATWGDVIDIGIRATKIKTTDNIIIVIPNNEIMKRDIVNYTLISSAIRVRVNIGVAYDTDIEKAKGVILKVAEGTDWISKQPKPKVVVRNFGESSVDLQLRVWIQDARRRMDTISHITDSVKAAFDAEGIEIPYPKRDIHIIRNKSE